MSETTSNENYKQSKESGRQLAYTNEFKEFVAGNRGVLSAVFNSIEKGFEEESIELEDAVVEKFKNRTEFYDKFYKVTVGEKSYFVKRERFSEDWRADGFQEFKASNDLTALLEGIEGVEVVPYFLGYKSANSSYFVSEWRDELTTPLSAYLTKMYTSTDEAAWIKYHNLNQRAFDVQEILKDEYADVNHGNMAYDENTDTIILFDLMKLDDFHGNKGKVRNVA